MNNVLEKVSTLNYRLFSIIRFLKIKIKLLIKFYKFMVVLYYYIVQKTDLHSEPDEAAKMRFLQHVVMQIFLCSVQTYGEKLRWFKRITQFVINTREEGISKMKIVSERSVSWYQDKPLGVFAPSFCCWCCVTRITMFFKMQMSIA